MIEISKLRMDGGTQARAAIHEDTVAEYAEAMADEETVFPPITVYYDGKDYWLADGFHRVAAWSRTGRTEVPAEVRQGDRRRAILHSVAANSIHGLRRTNDDKRRSVMTLLDDEEWSQWSNREIARRCSVSEGFVRSLRTERSEATERTYTTKHGTTATMDTSNIGKPKDEEIPSETDDDRTAAPERPDGGRHGSRAASGRSDAPSGAGDTAEEGDEPAVGESPAPDLHATERRALAKLTREGLEDEVIGLRAENTELRERVRRQTGDIADLKMKMKDFTDDKDEVIRRLQKQVEHQRSEMFRANETARAKTASARKAQDEAKALQKRFEAQEIPLN